MFSGGAKVNLCSKIFNCPGLRDFITKLTVDSHKWPCLHVRRKDMARGITGYKFFVFVRGFFLSFLFVAIDLMDIHTIDIVRESSSSSAIYLSL